MKIIKELKVVLNGPLWRVHEIEIEAIDVIDLWEEDNGEAGQVEVKDFNLSDDEILDVFVHIGAPNGTAYTLSISGRVSNGDGDDVISYKEDFVVERKGRLRIDISKNISELV